MPADIPPKGYISNMKSGISIHTSHSRIKRILTTLIRSSLLAADPDKAMERLMTVKGTRLFVEKVPYDLSGFKRIVCVGGGKAAAPMAIALERLLGERLEGGVVVVKEGYGDSASKITIIEAGHPLPDQRGIQATRRIMNLAQSLTKTDLLIVLLSGGASSLLCAPASGLTLRDKWRTTDLLLRSGATIHELNTVRKHLSAVKGGQLAQITPATLLTLILSDVMGDEPATIGSGPTVPDPSTFRNAREILTRYRIWAKVPDSVQRHLEKGLTKKIPETLKPVSRKNVRNRHFVLANNCCAMKGAALAARQLHLKPVLFPIPLQGEAKEIGSILGGMAKDLVSSGNPVHPPACLIAGGEPTVTVTGKGRGGRVQECVLAAAEEVAGLKKVFVAGFGTDGTDGPTDAAGAVVDGQTFNRARRMGLALSTMLKANDSYAFFNKVGGHIMTGPTRTNVNDIYVIIAF
jgi:glycerate 2-kinase